MILGDQFSKFRKMWCRELETSIYIAMGVALFLALAPPEEIGNHLAR